MEKLKSYMKNSRKASTQSEWAKIFGISQGMLSRILNGSRKPGWDLIQRIEKATGGKVRPAHWKEEELK